MDANTHIEKILSSINSLGETILSLQDHVDSLHVMHQNFNEGSTSYGEGTHTELQSKIESIKSNIIDRSLHVENLASNVLHPERIQQKMDNLKKIQERNDYWKNRK